MRFFVCLTVAATMAPLHAQVLPPVGPTYPIQEQSVLAQIEQRLRSMERSGELARLQNESARRAADSIRNPAPIAGLSAGPTARTHYYDPTYTLDRNVFDNQGRLLFAAGTKKNPLEVVSMTRRLLFFDARDARQVTRARELITKFGADGVKPVLVGGSYADLMKQWKLQVYYDQQGTLVRKFQIRQVPALVSQEGMRLRIDELETK